MRTDVPDLSRRLDAARQALESCTLCPLQCRANRLAGQTGLCGLDARTFCFRRCISYAEEIELLPSYMVYLSGCNLRCASCLQAPSSIDGRSGELLNGRSLAAILENQVSCGARSINLVGGEPGLHPHTILEAVIAAGRQLPLVLNTNLYLGPAALELLDGLTGLYLVDFKFGDNACARRLAGIEQYIEVMRRNLKLLASRPVLVRHLLLPGHAECCFEPMIRWLAKERPGVPVHVMGGFIPAWQSAAVGLDRTVDGRQLDSARQLASDCGACVYDPGTFNWPARNAG